MLSRDTVLLASSLTGSTTAFYASGIFFTGSHVIVPLLSPLPAKTAASVFEDFYHRGVATVVPLVAFSSFCTLLASAMDPIGRFKYASASALTAGSLAWTAVVMLGTYNRLLKLAKDDARDEEISSELKKLLKTWNWMNIIRASFGLAGGALGMATLLRI